MPMNPLILLVAAGLLAGCTAVQSIARQNLDLSPPGQAVQFFYESQGGKVESYLIRPKGEGRFPLMVLLHGHSLIGAGAKRVVPVAEQFSAELCYASLAISLPGYGLTEVEGDANRDVITRVVMDGISEVSKLPWVDRKRVMLYGFSRGALFAATLAGRVPSLRGVILHSGAYDIDRLHRETQSYWVRLSINPNGEPNPRLFSVLPEVLDWTAPALILHGDKDQVVPVNQAFLLRDQLKDSGKPYRFVLFPDAGHRLPLRGVKDEVFSFLNQHVGSACGR